MFHSPPPTHSPKATMETTLEYIGSGRGLLECGWQGNNMGVIIQSFNVNVSPKMSYGVLECDIMLQNYRLMIL